MNTTRHRLTLPDPYPPVNIAEQDRPDGTVRYRFRAPRATGTLLLYPDHVGTEEAIPSGLFVQFGEGDRWGADHRRTGRPIVNGVPLYHGVILQPAEYLTHDRTDLRLSRPTGPYTCTAAPDATSRYASAIIRAVVAHWHARPDRDQLLRAAAVSVAAARLRDLYDRKINPTRARIAGLEAELAERLELARALCQLAAEHHARRTPAPQAPGKPEPERARKQQPEPGGREHEGVSQR